MKISIITIVALATCLLVGCGNIASREDMNLVQKRFEAKKDQAEQAALAGQITWVKAEKFVRNLDKEIMNRLDEKGIYHTWKYTSDDEEYYAICIALAEKLDNHQITYAEFDARRTQALNQIRARSQLIDNSTPRVRNCYTSKEADQYRTTCY